jgi:hypothetical protein
MWHAWGRREIHRGILWGNLKQRVHLVYPGINGKIIFKSCLTFSYPASYIIRWAYCYPPTTVFIYSVNKYTY